MKRIERLVAESGEGIVSGSVRSARSIVSRCSHALLSICILLVLLGGVGFVILRGGVNSDLLRDEAQKSLSHILGEGASASIGSAALSRDRNGHVAMEARDVSIVDPKQGVAINGIKSVRLGLAPLPLLTGKLRVAQLEVEGVAFDLPEARGGGFWKSLPYDEKGYVDFDAASGEIFAAMRRSLELLSAQDTRVIRIANSSVSFKVGEEEQVLDIERARLTEDRGKIAITGTVVWKGRKIALDGDIERRASDKALSAFRLNVKDIPVVMGSPPQVAPVINGNRVNPAHFELDAYAQLTLSGFAADGDKPERLAADLTVDGIDMQLGKVDNVRGNVRLSLEHRVGSHKIEIKPSRLVLGGLQAQFNGAFGPEQEAESNTDGPSYRFEVLTTSATSMPPNPAIRRSLLQPASQAAICPLSNASSLSIWTYRRKAGSFTVRAAWVLVMVRRK